MLACDLHGCGFALKLEVWWSFFWKVARLSRDTELRVGDFGRSVKRRKVFFLRVWRKALAFFLEKLFWKAF